MRTYCIAQRTLLSALWCDLNGKGILKKRVDICICITDSLCCTPEQLTIYNIANQLYSNKY